MGKSFAQSRKPRAEGPSFKPSDTLPYRVNDDFQPAPPARRLPLALLAAFFLSGGVALIYQVLWTRRLGLIFGVTIQAASTVLACFMAGLALGSYVAGRRSDRLANPLRTFAWVELLIGVCALVTPFALNGVEAAFVALAPSLPDQGFVKILVRIALSGPVLIVPAVLMGATYPLVLQAVTRTRAGLRRGAALLYGINTAGAIAGVIAGSMWMVPTIGIQRSFAIAAALNVVVAMAALVISRGFAGSVDDYAAHADPGSASSAATSTPAATSTVAVTSRARLTVLVVIALSGAVSLALEIIWFRVLVFFLRPTTYAFASMLATVLFGLAAGSLIVTPLLKRRANWIAVLAVTEILIGITGLISAFLMVRSYDVIEWMRTWTWLGPPYDFVLPLIASAAVAIVPTSLLLGAAFPLGLLLWTERDREDTGRGVGRRVGLLYALNVTGAIVGSLVAGFLLIPMCGSQTSLVIVTALPVAGGIALLLSSGARWSGPAMAASLIAFGALAASLPDVFHDVIVRRYVDHQVMWHGEDAQAAVSVVNHRGTRTLLIDGMHHANDGAGMVTGHGAIGGMGLAVHSSPHDILVVGFGAGATAASASILPDSQTQVVELSPSVLEAGRYFERTNHGVLHNPRVSFRIDDGRNFLKTTTRKFDVITADLLLPEMAGAANLYSADYFAIARDALAPGGLMVQWIDPTEEYRYQLMLRSFVAVFPYVSIWHDGSIVMGSNEPVTLDARAFELKVAHQPVRELFERIGVGTFEQLRAAYVGSRDEALAYLGEGPLLRDDKPVIEYFLSIPKTGIRVDVAKMKR